MRLKVVTVSQQRTGASGCYTVELLSEDGHWFHSRATPAQVLTVGTVIQGVDGLHGTATRATVRLVLRARFNGARYLGRAADKDVLACWGQLIETLQQARDRQISPDGTDGGLPPPAPPAPPPKKKPVTMRQRRSLD